MAKLTREAIRNHPEIKKYSKYRIAKALETEALSFRTIYRILEGREVSEESYQRFLDRLKEVNIEDSFYLRRYKIKKPVAVKIKKNFNIKSLSRDSQLSLQTLYNILKGRQVLRKTAEAFVSLFLMATVEDFFDELKIKRNSKGGS